MVSQHCNIAEQAFAGTSDDFDSALRTFSIASEDFGYAIYGIFKRYFQNRMGRLPLSRVFPNFRELLLWSSKCNMMTMRVELY